jgi:tRNA G18 (ribose-2'-O)-methylase SpoU
MADENRPRPMALILGNERAGVDPGLIALSEAVLSLPMTGQKASLNVAVAFGAAVYWLIFA